MKTKKLESGGDAFNGLSGLAAHWGDGELENPVAGE